VFILNKRYMLIAHLRRRLEFGQVRRTSDKIPSGKIDWAFVIKGIVIIRKSMVNGLRLARKESAKIHYSCRTAALTEQ